MKKIIFSFALVSLGAFASAQQQVSATKLAERPSIEQMQNKRLEKMKAELGLSDEQVAKIKTVFSEKDNLRKAYREAATNEDRVALMNKIKSENELSNSKIQAVLTPEQVAKWKELRTKEMGNFRMPEAQNKALETTAEKSEKMEKSEVSKKQP